MQPIPWIEQPIGALVGVGSLWPIKLCLGSFVGQNEPTPMIALVLHFVHRMGWMIHLFFICLFTLH